MTRLAFVSAPGSSAFMSEILEAVAAEVDAATDDVEVVCESGYLDAIVDQDTVAVVVPHEYFAVAPPAPAATLARTIGFGVEHPGTETFEVSTRAAAQLGSWFEIGRSSVTRLRTLGHRARPFPLGYTPLWDRWHGAERHRSVDVTYLGTADEWRLATLARSVPHLAGLRTEILVPPHEPMTRTRPDFLRSEEKWDLLADSKVLINLHREGKSALEWVRVLEALINGCVVVTEPSTDLGPLVPGRHLVVADPANLGPAVRAILDDPQRLARMRRAAYRLCRDRLSMSSHALELAAEARRLAAAPFAPVPVTPGRESVLTTDDRVPSWAEAGTEPPLAVWVPSVPFPDVTPSVIATPNRKDAGPESSRFRPGADVICVQLPGDGPWQLTHDSLRQAGHSAELLVARPGPATLLGAGVSTPDHLQVVPSGSEHRGRERNALLARSDSEYIAVLNGGDEVLGDSLQRLTALLDEDPEVDVVACLARVASAGLVNVFPPELRRLESHPYLSRGFVVRRSYLEAVGGFTEDADLAAHVDHHFWLTVARAGAGVRWLRSVGLDLWTPSPVAG